MSFFFVILLTGNAAAASSGTHRQLPDDDNENAGHFRTSSSTKQPINGGFQINGNITTRLPQYLCRFNYSFIFIR